MRYQHASEMRSDLKRLQRDSGSGRGPASAAGSISDSHPVAASTASSGSVPARVVTPPAATHGSSSSVSAVARQHRVGTAVVSLVVLAVLAALLSESMPESQARAPFHSRTTRSRRSPTAAKLTRPPSRPDGRYLLHVQIENGQRSLWLRNIPTGSDTQIIPPAPACISRSLSPPMATTSTTAGLQPSAPTSSISIALPCSAATPGGQIVRDIDSNPAFSPDGQRMAFIRANDPDPGKYRLLSAKSRWQRPKPFCASRNPRVAPIPSRSAGRPMGKSWLIRMRQRA